MVLSRRLRRFTDLERGIGGAVAVLSVQVDDMNRTIRQAEKAAAESAERLNELSARSEDAARRLELMIAAMHDLPIDSDQARETEAPSATRPEPDEAPAPSIFSSRRNLGERAA
jgi:hypothetical protein